MEGTSEMRDALRWPWGSGGPTADADRSAASPRAFFHAFHHQWKAFHDAATLNLPADVVTSDDERVNTAFDRSLFIINGQQHDEEGYRPQPPRIVTDMNSMVWESCASLSDALFDEMRLQDVSNQSGGVEVRPDSEGKEAHQKLEIDAFVQSRQAGARLTQWFQAIHYEASSMIDQATGGLTSHERDEMTAQSSVITEPYELFSRLIETSLITPEINTSEELNRSPTLRMVDLPTLSAFPSTIKYFQECTMHQAQAQLERLTTPGFQGSTDVFALIFDTPTLLESANAAPMRQSDSEETEAQPSPNQDVEANCPVPRLERVRIDFLLRSRQPKRLEDTAQAIFHDTMRQNAACFIFPALQASLNENLAFLHHQPDYLSDLFRIHGYSRHHGDPQLLTLPLDVVQADEAKLRGACSSVILDAEKEASSLRTFSRSLTALMISIPSFWNSQAVVHTYSSRTEERISGHDTRMEQRRSTNDDDIEGCQRSSQQRRSSDLNDIQGSQPSSSLSQAPNNHPTKQRENLIDEKQSARCVHFKVVEKELTTEQLVAAFLANTNEESGTSRPQKKIDDAPINICRDQPRSNAADAIDIGSIIAELARPAMWCLARAKLLRLESSSFTFLIQNVRIEVLEAIVVQQHNTVRRISVNPSNKSHEEIVDACTTLRQAIFLHILALVVSVNSRPELGDDASIRVLQRILASHSYMLALSPSQHAALATVHQRLGGENTHVPSILTTIGPSDEGNEKVGSDSKKLRHKAVGSGLQPTRVMCSPRFLDHDIWMEELSAEMEVGFIERDLPIPLHIVVDERNGICFVTKEDFKDDLAMKRFTFHLANIQRQFERIWMVIVEGNTYQEQLHSFYAATVNFSVDVRCIACDDDSCVTQCVRDVIDACAELALAERRILPRLWFERPFLLEDESQLERFLASTNAINHFAAQSLLHRISMEELMTKSLEELQLCLGNALPQEQLQLLWSIMHRRHGFGPAVVNQQP